MWPLFCRWLQLKRQCVQFRWLFHRSEHLRGYRTYRCWNGTRVALWSLTVKLLYFFFTMTFPGACRHVPHVSFCLVYDILLVPSYPVSLGPVMALWMWCTVGLWPCHHLNLFHVCCWCLFLSVLMSVVLNQWMAWHVIIYIRPLWAVFNFQFLWNK